jgi:hypothetical protein
VNGELVVPPGDYFMMGDNRDNSRRQQILGLRAPREDIIGTPVMIYMSIDAPEEVWGPGHSLCERFETYAQRDHSAQVKFAGDVLFHIF